MLPGRPQGSRENKEPLSFSSLPLNIGTHMATATPQTLATPTTVVWSSVTAPMSTVIGLILILILNLEYKATSFCNLQSSSRLL